MTNKEMKITIKNKIQKLKKEIMHIILSDIGKADKANKLWDFFTEHAKEIFILSEVQNFTEIKEIKEILKEAL